MNYERVYAAFINDRKAKQPEAPAYFEKHHILPRALGGGDEESNLIRLIPEDHYFAHLLLAQIHGGSQWSCVLLLSGRRRHNTPWAEIVGSARYGYGLAKRMHSLKERGKEGLKGAENGNHNPTAHEWKNICTGERKAATLSDMWTAHGNSRGAWTAVVSGARNRIGDWTLAGNDAKRGLKGRPCSFVNRDGRTFHGTQKQFAGMAGLSLASVSRVCRHADVTLCGWRLEGSTDIVSTAPRDGRTSGAQGRGTVHRLRCADASLIVGKAADLAQRFGIKPTSMRSILYDLRTGGLERYRGMTLDAGPS